MNTADFARHDQCPRLRTWSARYDLPRIPLAEALYLSVREGLLSGDYLRAGVKFMALAANPGLDIEGRNVYDIAVHHQHLVEVLCCYLLTDGPWKAAGTVSLGAGTFEPLGYLLPDGRLRRVVLCSSWHEMRAQEERTSWWTVADTAATGRPMLVNVLVIGSAIGGYRKSPWTTGFVHPENGILRIRKREGEFTERWKRVYRETASIRASDWLLKMQQDEAFDGIVEAFTVDVPADRVAVTAQMERMARGMGEGSVDMRRAGCFQKAPCPMARLCHHEVPLTPADAGWREKAVS